MEKRALFEIAVDNTEHGEWQGTVLFPDSEKRYTFQSLLELFRIVDGRSGKNGTETMLQETGAGTGDWKESE